MSCVSVRSSLNARPSTFPSAALSLIMSNSPSDETEGETTLAAVAIGERGETSRTRRRNTWARRVFAPVKEKKRKENDRALTCHTNVEIFEIGQFSRDQLGPDFITPASVAM